jgi:hypothetical protein
MRFTQVIEFTTDRIDDFQDGLDAVIVRMEGRRIPHRAVVQKDRALDNRYLLMVEFPTYDLAMENSNRPEIGEFAAFLFGICPEPPTFRDLDVLREEDL